MNSSNDAQKPVESQSTVAVPNETFQELKALVEFYSNECKLNGPALNYRMTERLRVRLNAIAKSAG